MPLMLGRVSAAQVIGVISVSASAVENGVGGIAAASLPAPASLREAHQGNTFCPHMDPLSLIFIVAPLCVRMDIMTVRLPFWWLDVCNDCKWTSQFDLPLWLPVPCKSICIAADGGSQSAMGGSEFRQPGGAAVDANSAGHGARGRRVRPRVDYAQLHGGD